MTEDDMWALINGLVLLANVIGMALACWLSTRTSRRRR